MSVIVSCVIAAPSPLPRVAHRNPIVAAARESPNLRDAHRNLAFPTLPPLESPSRVARSIAQYYTHSHRCPRFLLPTGRATRVPAVSRDACRRVAVVVVSPSSFASRRRRVNVAFEREARERFRSRRRVVANAPMVGRDRPLRGAKRRRGARSGRSRPRFGCSPFVRFHALKVFLSL